MLLPENRFNDTPWRSEQRFDRVAIEVLIVTTILRIDVLAKHARSPEIRSNPVLTTSHISDFHARQGTSSCRSIAMSISSAHAMQTTINRHKTGETCDNAYLTRSDAQKLLVIKRQLSNWKKLMLDSSTTNHNAQTALTSKSRNLILESASTRNRDHVEYFENISTVGEATLTIPVADGSMLRIFDLANVGDKETDRHRQEIKPHALPPPNPQRTDESRVARKPSSGVHTHTPRTLQESIATRVHPAPAKISTSTRDQEAATRQAESAIDPRKRAGDEHQTASSPHPPTPSCEDTSKSEGHTTTVKSPHNNCGGVTASTSWNSREIQQRPKYNHRKEDTATTQTHRTTPPALADSDDEKEDRKKREF